MIRRIKMNAGQINAVERLTGRKYTRHANHADLTSEYLDVDQITDMIRDLIVVATGHKQREQHDV